MVIVRGTVVPPLVSPGMLSLVISPGTTAEDAGSVPLAVPAFGPVVVSTVHGALSVRGTLFIYPVSIVLVSLTDLISSAVASGAVRVSAVWVPRRSSYITEYETFCCSLNFRACVAAGGVVAAVSLHSTGAGCHNGVGTDATIVVAE